MELIEISDRKEPNNEEASAREGSESRVGGREYSCGPSEG
jgi:hypothetical protein